MQDQNLELHKSVKSTLNPNIKNILIICLIQGIFDSLWGNTILIAYIEVMMNDPKYVGIAEAVQGLACLIASIPIGLISDRYSKSKIVKIGAYFIIVSFLLTVATLIWIGENHYQGEYDSKLMWQFYALCFVMGCWGVVSGLINGPCLALFADSDRSKYYTYLYSAYVGSLCLGPLTNIILFKVLGDVWQMKQLYYISLCSLCVGAFLPIPMFFLNDKYTMNQDKQDDEVDVYYKGIKQVPYLIFINALIVGCGSGMSIKYFILFYKENCLMTPTQVQLLFTIQPLVSTIFSILIQKISTYFGRVQTQLTCVLWASIQLILFYVFIDQIEKSIPLVMVLQIIRSSIANGYFPLEESVLMDAVPKNRRGFWKSLDSISSFGWSGSAFLGGMISKKNDYYKTFLYTAILTSCGTPILLYLCFIVPKKEKQIQKKDSKKQSLLSNQDDKESQSSNFSNKLLQR